MVGVGLFRLGARSSGFLSFGSWPSVSGRTTEGRGVAARRKLVVFLLTVLSGSAFGQTQAITEQNITDAILGRRPFSAEELNSFDLNRDGVVDVADLAYHKVHNAEVVPSVSFAEPDTNACEDVGAIGIRLVFTKEFEAPVTLSYTLSGTATYGPKSQGGDYTVSGYDAGTGAGAIQVSAGDDEAFIAVTIQDDALFDENMETVTFLITGGDAQSYFLGAQQSHTLYIDDNDAVWTAGLQFPEGGGYASLRMEITQEDGAFTGRALSDGTLIPAPEPGDPNGSGEDGWEATFYSGSQTLRVEIGPIPVDKSLSFFDTYRSRYYVMQIGPGLGAYQYDPHAVFSGVVTETLVPVQSRLGPEWPRRSYLKRESTGTVALVKQPSEAIVEEVTLQDAG